jgi:HSP20 family molecular chaperone IbpA
VTTPISLGQSNNQAQDSKGKGPNQDLTDDQKLFRDLRSNLLGDRKMLEKYFQKDFLNKIDKMFQDSMNQMGSDDFDQIFKTFQDSFNGSFDSLGSGLNSNWKQTKEGMVLIVEGAVTQGGNFDLKVKEGQVSISGALEKDLGQMGKRVMRFSRSFPVPKGTDPNKVRIENQDGALQIIFPWQKGSANKVPAPTRPKNTPLKKEKDDLVI